MIAAFFMAVSAWGQEFFEMMQDNSRNFYDIKKAAELYFESSSKGKGTGYKQYKRWEWFTEQRVYPSGDMSQVDGNKLYSEMQAFRRKYPSPKNGENTWSPLSLLKYDNVDGHWSPGVGRMDRVMVDPQNSNIIYAGAPTGGLWKSINGGVTWETKTDHLPSIGISGIAIDPNNSSIVYISTGDSDGAKTYSSGVYKSTDGGDTWMTTGLTYSIPENIQGKNLISHPTISGTLFFTSSLGIYRTINGGASWTQIISGAFDDIEFKPGDPTVIYATQNDAFYRSVNSGDSFSKVSVNASGRIVIGVTPANSSVVYLACGNEGIYRSNNSGVTFTLMGPHPFAKGLKWYMWAFAVSPVNPDLIHIGEMISWKSLDGGASWDKKTTDWLWGNSVGYTHCDFHLMKYFDNTLWVGTDGGVAKSTDDGENWTIYFNGLETTQIYNIGVCRSDASLVMFGSQDNGVYYHDGSDWWGWLGADGMDVIYDYSKPSTRYATIQNGELYCSSHSIAQAGEGGWVTPIAIHPTNPDILYIANKDVRKSTNGMRSWTTIGDIGSGFKNALAVADADPQTLYVSEGRKIWRTTNGGDTWIDITSTLPNRTITRIAIHPHDPLTVAITYSGYSTIHKVYITNDGGASWTNITRNLPNLPANSAVFGNNSKNSLYVGMDVGVFYIDNDLALWEPFDDGFPNAVVTDLEMNYAENLLFAGTYGRGVWKTTPRNPGVSAPPGKATAPQPENGITGVSKSVTLNWTPGSETTTHRISFGTDNPPPFVTESGGNFYTPGELDINTTYYWRVDEINSLGTTPGDIWSFTTTAINEVEYCPAAGSAGTGADYITRVSFGDIDNSSGQGLYEDYTNLSTDLNRGEDYGISVSLNFHWDKDTVAVWIDWNQDGDFSSEESVEMSILNSGHISTGTISVPLDAVIGKTRMRVRNAYDATPVPCGDIFGEVEDYTVNVTGFTSPPGYATLPSPFNGQQMVSTLTDLSWIPAEGALSHNIFFGMQSPPPFYANTSDTTFTPSVLLENKTYFWRIDEVYPEGAAKGREWSFTTFNSSIPNPLKVDFGLLASPVEQGFTHYNAEHGKVSSFGPRFYGALGANISVSLSWQEGGSEQAAAVRDRGSDIISSSPDLLRDWAGTDNRASGNPLTITISGLPEGEYKWSSWHHDPLDQSGEFSVTVNDATGAEVTGGLMITNGNLNLPDVSQFEATVKSDGSDISILFNKIWEEGDENAFFVINGFSLVKSSGTSVPGEKANDPDYLNLWPNPTGDVLYMEFMATDRASVRVIDGSGRQVYSGVHHGGTDQLSVAGLSPGVYMVVVARDGRITTGRFVKK